MADFDRSAEFRRNLKQLRETRAAGYAFESVPLGGDAQSRGDTEAAERAASDLRRLILQAKLEEKNLARENMRARTSAERLQLRSAGDTRGSLISQLRGEGFGTRSSPGQSMSAGGLRKLSKNVLSLRGGLKAAGGGSLLVTGVAVNLAGGAVNALMDVRDEYNAIKQAGGTDAQAKHALVGKARESVGGTAFQLIGGKSIWSGVLRGAGFSEQGAAHAIDRAISRTFNNSGLRRRELTEANRAVNEEGKTMSAWAKLDASSPQTFRLRSPADAAAYQAERRRINDLALVVGIKQDNREKFRVGRVAQGN